MVNRLYSLYLLQKQYGLEDVEFIESIEQNPLGVWEIHFWTFDYDQLNYIEFYSWEEVKEWILEKCVSTPMLAAAA